MKKSEKSLGKIEDSTNIRFNLPKRPLQSGGKSTDSNRHRKPTSQSQGRCKPESEPLSRRAIRERRPQENSTGHSLPGFAVIRTMATACRHPKVRIVSRHEDTEYVECLECGEVFDSEEFRDMEIEDTAETEDISDDA
jgi:hypothetical protein